ncbi:arsenic resistance N-acetyltransferase ArsN2 [Candidatus Oscillochloris fontis]|uniref:arsenic resistance N-acetyltransferase ArsN2 n=1 Tax=Candidatus Oscillochloris fontis TaxID=2496868 RepID=UPI001375CB19|nr:arsenic resistance N-acetyltransferase ArsN2 [Candidatus Oscillochloris fontis]
MTSIQITPATPSDLPAVLALLSANGLPHDGLAEHFDTALVARDGDTVVGSAALERYGAEALLRSVAVAAAQQSQGVGRQLLVAALYLARTHGIRRVYLLTTTAASYFSRYGFVPVARADVDPAVQVSAEFQGACPARAALLRLDLGG